MDFQKLFGSLLFAGCLFLAVGCSKTPDEEQIRQIIESMTAAMEAGKPAEIAEYLHADFRANRQMNAQQVKQMLMMYGLQQKSVSISVVSSETTIDPVYTDKAYTVMSVLTTGNSARGMLDNGGLHVVNLEWRKDDEWKLLKADWE